MKVFLVRHAKAGDREKWTQPDHLRPLTKPGRRQAEALARALEDEGIGEIFTSYYVRCAETVEPLGRALGLDVQLEETLVEGADPQEALRFIETRRTPTVLCTHGDVMDGVVRSLRLAGIQQADEAQGKKGATWVIEVDGGSVSSARYVPPPA